MSGYALAVALALEHFDVAAFVGTALLVRAVPAVGLPVASPTLRDARGQARYVAGVARVILLGAGSVRERLLFVGTNARSIELFQTIWTETTESVFRASDANVFALVERLVSAGICAFLHAMSEDLENKVKVILGFISDPV